MIVAISGTPGTGKSELALALSTWFGFERLDVSEIIARDKLSEGYDKKRDCAIVDVAKLEKHLRKKIKKKASYVIDSHLSGSFSPSWIDLCLVCVCELPVLKKRLEKRGYSLAKVRENLDSEIFRICYVEALENKHTVKVVDCTKALNKRKIEQLIYSSSSSSSSSS